MDREKKIKRAIIFHIYEQINGKIFVKVQKNIHVYICKYREIVVLVQQGQHNILVRLEF